MPLISPKSKKATSDKPETSDKQSAKNLQGAMSARKPKAGVYKDDNAAKPSSMVEAIMGKRQKLADGGEVKAPGIMPQPPQPKGLDYTDRPDKGYGKIVFKAEGGEVESPEADDYQEQNHEAGLKENYMDADDAQDMISAIRSKIHAKRMFR